AVLAANPASASLRLHRARSWHLAAACHRDHAGALGQVRRSGRQDRSAAADDDRPAGARRRSGAVRQDRPLRQLSHRRAACRGGVRVRPGDQRGAADLDRAGGRLGRARGGRLCDQQRRRQGRGPYRRGRAPRRGGLVRRVLPAPRGILGRLPHRLVHVSGDLRDRCRDRRPHHSQPGRGASHWHATSAALWLGQSAGRRFGTLAAPSMKGRHVTLSVSVGIDSEIGPLREVILHRPGRELDRLTPSNAAELLFDDVLWGSKARLQHDVFSEMLREHDVTVHLFADLLAGAIEAPGGREFVTERICTPARFGPRMAGVLARLFADTDPVTLADYLIGGLTKTELATPGRPGLTWATLADDDFLLTPLPNTMFQRDNAAWVGSGLSINPMAKPARLRESINTRAVYRYHPLLRDGDYYVYYGDDDLEHSPATLEGGDIAVVAPGVVLAGMGERTSPMGVEILASRLFETGQAHLVIAIELPIGAGGVRILMADDDARSAEREQWDDADNFLAIAPGLVVGYDRNVVTNGMLTRHGIDVITIDGSELGRGRGGSRCLCCP